MCICARMCAYVCIRVRTPYVYICARMCPYGCIRVHMFTVPGRRGGALLVIPGPIPTPESRRTPPRNHEEPRRITLGGSRIAWGRQGPYFSTPLSKIMAGGAHCYNRYFCKLLQPWPIDACLKVTHLSAMAVKVCKSIDYSRKLIENIETMMNSLLKSLLLQIFAAMADRWLPQSCASIGHGGNNLQK